MPEMDRIDDAWAADGLGLLAGGCGCGVELGGDEAGGSSGAAEQLWTGEEAMAGWRHGS